MLLAVVGVLLSSAAADAVASAGRIRAGVRVAGLELGGRRFEDAERILTARARRLAETPATFVAEGERITVTPEDVGFFPDVDATLSRAKRAGREGHALSRLWQGLRSYFSPTDVGWVSVLDREDSKKVIDDWGQRFDNPGHEAGIEADAEGRIVPVEPLAGRRLVRRTALNRVVQAMQAWPRRPVELPFEIRGRKTDAKDAEAAAERAAVLVQEPITLLSPTGGLELTAEDLARLLAAVPRKGLRGWTLDVKFSADLLKTRLGPRMTDFERPSKDASFNVSGAQVTVSPSQDGLRFDAVKTAQALDEVAVTAPPRSTDAAFTVERPKLSTEDAKALNIHELVSTFTTRHSSGQPRVKNIHLIADKVDGIVVRPGESFSLNKRAGERTAEKGYVLAPMIFDGEFKDQIGGGVSQFATTMFNAVFFGGYDFEAYKPHSYYISRYPAGREATVSWPAPDLKWRNDSPSGVLIKTGYTGSSISVSLYGDKAGKTVEAEAEERTNIKPPTDKRTPDPSVPPGTERVSQKGGEGFDIVVWRVIKTRDGKVRREKFVTRYQPQPRIIAFGPGTPAPATPGPSPSPGAHTPPPMTPPATPRPAATPKPAL